MNGTAIMRVDRRLAALVAALLLAVVLLAARPAVAQTYPIPPSDPQPPTEVLGAKFARQPTSTGTGTGGLAVTGTDIVGLTVLGVGLIGAGTIVVRMSRRRTTAA